jgi:hypothetical protein
VDFSVACHNSSIPTSGDPAASHPPFLDGGDHERGLLVFAVVDVDLCEQVVIVFLCPRRLPDLG